MQSSFPAHITFVKGSMQVQTVEEHCRKTAEYAAKRISGSGLYYTAYLAGLLHDMGKYTEKYKTYIEKAARGEKVERGSVNHTFCGVIYLLEKYHTGTHFQKLTCEIIAHAIGAHHGEFDCIDPESNSGFEHRLKKDKTEICYEEAVTNYLKYCSSENEIDDLFNKSCAEIQALISKVSQISKPFNVTEGSFIFGMIARLILSAVIDGDRRDTAEFMLGQAFNYPSCDKSQWKELLDSFTKKVSSFDRSTPINKARAQFSELCYEFSKNPTGIYKLNLPTGGGKTLSALRYALSHAHLYGKRRIFFVIPLLSVLDQNSKVIRKYIDDDSLIIEHHSNVVKDFETKEEYETYELLAETWESPIVITTLVQLLNSLFCDKTTAIRRMSALANSIIIIDEVQSLPKKVTHMFNMAMNFLMYCCNTTIILSSATQPCLDEVKVSLRVSEPQDVVPYQKEYFDVFKRVNVIDKTTPYGMSFEELAEFATEIFNEVSSLLIICNTKASACKLFENMKNLNPDTKVYHLSTSMCQKHRTEKLSEIIDCLSKREKVICVSTQLVEAGIDFSFESVIRIEAGMDSVSQAAGRCNRSYDYGRLCNVYIVNLKSGCENLNMLKEIYIAQQCTMNLLYNFGNSPENFDCDLLSERSIESYYDYFYKNPDISNSLDYRVKLKNGFEVKLFELLSKNEVFTIRSSAKHYFLNHSFKTAGNLFEVFEENTYDAIVPYNDEAKELISDICSERAEYDIDFLKKLTEKAKPYVINLFSYQLHKLLSDGMIYQDKQKRFYILNELNYDQETGLKNTDSINLVL